MAADLLATADALSQIIAARAADLPDGAVTDLHRAFVVLRDLARAEERLVQCESTVTGHGPRPHRPTPGCTWPHEVTPAGPLPQVGHPLRSTD